MIRLIIGILIEVGYKIVGKIIGIDVRMIYWDILEEKLIKWKF